MNTIYTATAANDGFYIALAVAASSADQARELFAPCLVAPEDEGGIYTLADDVTARVADEEGDYLNDSTSSLEMDSATADMLLANPGKVEMLDSGANG